MRAVFLVVVSACGRIGFSDRATADATPTATDGSADAVGCVDGDGICPSGCLGMDSDCTAACGDGVCSGNLGESCTGCAADCKTAAMICGNGVCGAGEDSANCMPDCGPTPWPFSQLETDFLTALNNMRTAGTTCAGGPGTPSAALVVDTADPSPAHHNAWEIAHDNNMLGDTSTCSGIAMTDAFVGPAGYSIAVWGWNYFDAAAAVQGLLSAGSSCDLLIDPARTTVMLGAAHDVVTGWAIFVK